MGCLLAYQVQNKEAKPMGDAFVLLLRDILRFVLTAKLGILFGYIAPFHFTQIYNVPYSFVPQRNDVGIACVYR